MFLVIGVGGIHKCRRTIVNQQRFVPTVGPEDGKKFLDIHGGHVAELSEGTYHGVLNVVIGKKLPLVCHPLVNFVIMHSQPGQC